MKVYVRAPYPENRLAELRELFDEVLYEPWTETGERYTRTRCWRICWRFSPTCSSPSSTA